jgi:signal transduction histidine kinase
MVNDLLDTARLESGKVGLRLTSFRVDEIFAALRGMFRPLACERAMVNLVFDEVSQLPSLVSDESKVSQILRNFISNALKNTEAGEIRVSAEALTADQLRLSVTDTGIGIAREDHDRIFEDFVQLESTRPAHGHGTGLGLPLCKRLALILGGHIQLKSTPGKGSTFSLILPLVHHDKASDTMAPGPLGAILSRDGMSETFPPVCPPFLIDSTHAMRGLERPLARTMKSAQASMRGDP